VSQPAARVARGGLARGLGVVARGRRGHRLEAARASDHSDRRRLERRHERHASVQVITSGDIRVQQLCGASLRWPRLALSCARRKESPDEDCTFLRVTPTRFRRDGVDDRRRLLAIAAAQQAPAADAPGEAAAPAAPAPRRARVPTLPPPSRHRPVAASSVAAKPTSGWANTSP
jgi:hypothetical protein